LLLTCLEYPERLNMLSRRKKEAINSHIDNFLSNFEFDFSKIDNTIRNYFITLPVLCHDVLNYYDKNICDIIQIGQVE